MAHQQQQGQFDSELLECSPPPELVIMMNENQEDANQIYIQPSEVFRNKKHNQTSESDDNDEVDENDNMNLHDDSRDKNNKKNGEKTGIKRGKYGRVSNERRQILIDMYENEGLNLKYAAKLLRIHYKTAWNIVSEYKKTSRINRSTRDKSGSRASKLTKEVLEQIKEFVKEHSKYSLKQVKEELEQKNPGFTISTSSIDYALKNLKLRQSRKREPGRKSK